MKKRIKSGLIWIFTRTRLFDFLVMRFPCDFCKEVLALRIQRALGLTKTAWQEMEEAFIQLVPVVKAYSFSVEELASALYILSSNND